MVGVCTIEVGGVCTMERGGRGVHGRERWEGCVR